MGSSFVDEILDAVRQISFSFSDKLSRLLTFFIEHKNASSLGAIACFALFICTWRYLRGLRLHRNPKRINSQAGNTSQTGDVALRATGASASITEATQRGTSTRTTASLPVQLSVAQVVRQQLNGGKRMTCQLLGVVLEESSPEALKSSATVRPTVVDVLSELGKACDMYFFAKVVDDASEVAVMSALDSAGFFASGALSQTKVLFCSTDTGVIPFVRQLEPDWHVDTSGSNIEQLKKYVRFELHIAPLGSEVLAANVVSTPTLERYFGPAPIS